jgi:hypothetical protein
MKYSTRPAFLASLADITRYALYQHAAFCIVKQTALARTVRSRKHHGTRSNHFAGIHRGRLYPTFPPSGSGTTIDCPTLITLHKALDSRGYGVRNSHIM